MSSAQPTASVLAPAAAMRTAAPAQHVRWLCGGLALAFAFPFVLADRLEIDRDLYYGLYALAVAGFVAAWLRATSTPWRPWLTRNWLWGTILGVVAAGVLVAVVLRTDPATPRPEGLDLAAAVAWRGVLYGVTDAVLLSVFPILAVFAAFGPKVPRQLGRRLLAGSCAMLASLAFAAAYHVGYSDFRSEKLRKPLAGDVVWSAPTLFTLSPLGAPIAHVSLHVTAVLHSYDTETFLPPHRP